MTDQTTSASDLNLLGAAPAPVAQAAMSYAEAESRKAAMLADPMMRRKIMDGDVETTAEYKRVIEGLALNQPPKPAEPNNAEDMVDSASGLNRRLGILSTQI